MPDTKRQAVHLPSDRDCSGRDLGDAELANLERAIRSGKLNSTGGELTAGFESAFAQKMGRDHGIACSSGTAAVHCALAALDLQPGDQVITTAITDMGAIMPIIYEGAVPVFADVEPASLNLSAETIRHRISARTKAIIVTHLFGRACEMSPIIALAEQHGVVVIEDCAQAFLAKSAGRIVGSFGQIACYSFQQGKHMTTGEGGMVTCDDPQIEDRMRRFINKGWGYGDATPDHLLPGLNYRLTELQSAVGIAQLAKLDSVVARRRASASQLIEVLTGLKGLALPTVGRGDEHSYWRFALGVDADIVPGGADALGAALLKNSLHCQPRYIQKPAFDCAVLRAEKLHPLVARVCAEVHADKPTEQEYPGTYRGLAQVLVLPWNEHYQKSHVAFIAEVIRHAYGELCA